MRDHYFKVYFSLTFNSITNDAQMDPFNSMSQNYTPRQNKKCMPFLSRFHIYVRYTLALNYSKS